VHYLRKLRLLAPVLHACLFALTWGLFWIQPQPLAQGPADWPFRVLFIVDLPISLIAFGAMFSSEARFPYALAFWGIVGTFWWYFLGGLIEKRLNRETVTGKRLRQGNDSCSTGKR
jgi:hypothetical protein